jgi:hypothetical protein
MQTLERVPGEQEQDYFSTAQGGVRRVDMAWHPCSSGGSTLQGGHASEPQRHTSHGHEGHLAGCFVTYQAKVRCRREAHAIILF